MKKSTKRLFALLMAAVMLLALTACGGSKTEEPAKDSGTETQEPAAETSGSKELTVYTAFPRPRSFTTSTSSRKRPASRSTTSASPPVRC